MSSAVVLTTGLALGIAYAILGVAVSMVQVATRTLHFAVGALVVGGVAVWSVLAVDAVTGLARPAALAVAMVLGAMASLVVAVLSGALTRRSAADRRDEARTVVALVVGGGVLQAIVARGVTATSLRPEPLVDVGGVAIGGTEVGAATVAAIVLGVPLLLAVALGVESTRLGARLRLVGSSPEAAEQLGIRSGRVRLGAWAAGGALAVFAGALIAPITFSGAGQAGAFTIRAVAAGAVLGVGRPRAAVAGGLAIGLAESFGQALAPSVGAELGVAVVVLGLLLVRGPRHGTARPW